jgi:hypothetical protein
MLFMKLIRFSNELSNASQQCIKIIADKVVKSRIVACFNFLVT